jgi:hypothetical protein
LSKFVLINDRLTSNAPQNFSQIMFKDVTAQRSFFYRYNPSLMPEKLIIIFQIQIYREYLSKKQSLGELSCTIPITFTHKIGVI